MILKSLKILKTELILTIFFIKHMKKQQLQETLDYLIKNGIEQPYVGIVLGTGFGALIDEIVVEKKIAYADIPNFPEATVEFHSGKMIYGGTFRKKSSCHVWSFSFI